MNNTIQHPTHLWISDSETLEYKIIEFLQAKLCKNHACQSCIICMQIASKEHPWIIWINPERSYTLDQIDEIITMSSFQLDDQEQRFFIFPQAERLTDQCSNRLLKTIEEPFAGYKFFFLAARIQAIPLTIQSRCVLQKFASSIALEKHSSFLQPFLALRFTDPINFIKQLDLLEIKEQETKELIDELFDHWSTIAKKELESEKKNSLTTENILRIIQQAIKNPPMTGSTKIFWKNLYITAHHATKAKKNKN